MPPALTRLTLSGSPEKLGIGLGLAGKEAVQRFLVPHPLWAMVNSPDQSAKVGLMVANTQARFPRIWDELQGMAQGLDLPVMQVFAWNCRGDLLAGVPDGCTTVMVPGQTQTLAHNEDGFPFLRGHCFLAELRPEGEPSLTSFAYPGSIPGHTFAMNGAGLVQTVNNIRLTGVTATISRMVLGRAVLSCKTLDQAVQVLEQGTQSGGFHFALAQAGDSRLLSVEFGKGGLSVKTLDQPHAHANHALHLSAPDQIITDSSAHRQARADALLAAGTEPLAILQDASGPGLPIRRDAADDPDDENTIATLVARIGPETVDWVVHPHQGPVISGQIVPHRL
ncbi:C45 family autoproteolytic acyltransferase/hydrolase [Thioclava sp. FR2]|uniref:C45 family autoproteolytic acyltransferase/hydolase n=1 Tax=Thioclava sp. FR2 TaxID=3445780 RepID=UPI003EB88A9D